MAALSAMRRQGELKCRPVRYVCRGPQPATMRFYDRAADRQSHAHAARLGRVERVEHPMEIRRVQSRTRILHRNEHAVWRLLLGADQQRAPSLADAAHRLDGIENQVQHRLLQPDAISMTERQSLQEPSLQGDAILHQLAARQCDDLEKQLVDVEGVVPRWYLLDEVPDPVDDVA